jgi:hypothetical protein
MSRCKSCGQDLIWAKTAAGKSIPIDTAPAAGGNVMLQSRQGLPPLAIVFGAGTAPPTNQARRYTSHFATCPHGDQHRQPR